MYIAIADNPDILKNIPSTNKNMADLIDKTLTLIEK